MDSNFQILAVPLRLVPIPIHTLMIGTKEQMYVQLSEIISPTRKKDGHYEGRTRDLGVTSRSY